MHSLARFEIAHFAPVGAGEVRRPLRGESAWGCDPFQRLPPLATDVEPSGLKIQLALSIRNAQLQNLRFGLVSAALRAARHHLPRRCGNLTGNLSHFKRVRDGYQI